MQPLTEVRPARAPLTKAARRARVAALLGDQSVRSQQELAELLAAQGVRVTQATLSRDLGELGARKVRGRNGALVYALPEPGAAIGRASLPAGQLVRRLQELLLSSEASGTLVVLRTPPAGAHLLASALDLTELPEVAGTVAGDDTVLLVCRALDGVGGAQVAAALAERLLAIAEGSADGGLDGSL